MPRTTRDLMQTHVISVQPETPLLDAQRLLVEEEIHAAPVVDDEGTLLGVISAIDILRAAAEEHEAGASQPIYFREELAYSGPDWANMPQDFQDRLAQLTVADAMTQGVVTVTEDTPIAEVAGVLRSRRIHRVFVVREGFLSGVLSTFDLLSILEKEG